MKFHIDLILRGPKGGNLYEKSNTFRISALQHRFLCEKSNTMGQSKGNIL